MPTSFFADLVRELAQEGGTGPLTPTGAVPGHRGFAGVVPPGVSFHYAVSGIAYPDQWEVGTGRIGSDGCLLRDVVTASSAAGATVDFTPGLKTIALTVGADWFAARDTEAAVFAGEVTALGSELAGLSSELTSVAGALDAKQPLSTMHGSAGSGEATDAVTVRRGADWVNIPLAALAFRDADGRYALDGALAATEGSAAAPSIGFSGDAGTGLWRPDSNILGFATGGTERARISSAGYFGIGAAAPAALLHVRGGGAGATQLRLDSSASQPNIAFYNGDTNAANRNWAIVAGHTSFGDLSFRCSSAAGGNPLSAGTNMVRLLADGTAIFTPGGVERGRITSGGLELTMANGGKMFAEQVGSSSVQLRSSATTRFEVAASSAHQFYVNGAPVVTIGPAHLTPGSDNDRTLGASSLRWSVIYAGTGTINTSDTREKMWRGAPTETELRAARRIAGELGFFQWNDAIAAKGDDGARLHFGVRAQAVWAIMADEGLIDPIADGVAPSSRYAFLCHDAWDDAADDATRPAGDRFGIRGDQLALFLIAAQEERLAALEAAA